MHPILFKLPGLGWDVHAYGFLLGLALIFGWAVALRLGVRDKLPDGPLGTSYVLGVVAGIVVARFAHLMRHPQAFEDWRSLMHLEPGGLDFLAGGCVALLVSGMHVQRRKLPLALWWDAVAPAIALAMACERVGAHLAGVDFGGVAANANPFAVQYPSASPAFMFHREQLEALLPSAATRSLPVHPVQLYDAALALLGFALCLWLRRRRRFAGEVAASYLVFAAIAHATITMPLQADASPRFVGPWSGTSVVLVIAALAGAWFVRSRRRQATARASSAPRPWEGGPWSPKPS